jgi:NADH-quinone oxidoreductase subunit N
VLNAAAAAFYYLRVAVYMYMREPASEAEPLRHGRLLWAGLAVATVLTIVVGLFPTPVYDSAGQAAQALPQDVTQASN